MSFPESQKLTDFHRDEFHKLLSAFNKQALALVMTTEKATGLPVAAICTTFTDDQGGYIIEPLAIMPNGPLTETLNPPV